MFLVPDLFSPVFLEALTEPKETLLGSKDVYNLTHIIVQILLHRILGFTG